MMARPITMPVEAPKACAVRAATRAYTLVADAAARLVSTVTTKPPSRTGRRPKRSDSEPSSNCARPSPPKNSDTVSWTTAGSAAKATDSPGIAGRMMLTESGPTELTAISSASRRHPALVLDGVDTSRESFTAGLSSAGQRESGCVEPGSCLGIREGTERKRDTRMICVDPVNFVFRHQTDVDKT